MAGNAVTIRNFAFGPQVVTVKLDTTEVREAGGAVQVYAPLADL